MLIECQNCGAPLDITPNAWFVKCRYCAKSSRVAGLNTVAPQTPPGWQPPPVWTPPAHFPAPSEPIEYHETTQIGQAVAGVAMLILLGAGAFLALLVSSVGSSETGTRHPSPQMNPSPPSTAESPRWDGRSTIACGLGETLVIENQNAHVDGTVVQAAIGCTLRIKNSKLKGRTVIDAAMSVKVEIEGSTLDAESLVIDAAQAAQITVQKSSRLVSADEGIRMAQAAQLTLRDSTIEAKGTAIDMAMSCKLVAERATISSKSTSIAAASSSQVTLTGTKVQGKKKLAANVRPREK